MNAEIGVLEIPIIKCFFPSQLWWVAAFRKFLNDEMCSFLGHISGLPETEHLSLVWWGKNLDYWNL